MVNPTTIDQIAKQLKEPDWLTDLRRRSLARHTELPWPHPSDDIWRRIDVSQLDPARGFTPVEPALLDKVRLSERQLAAWTQPLADEQLVVRVNGSWLTQDMPRNLMVEDGIDAARRHPEPIRQAIEADGLTDAEQKLSSLNLAFHHDDVAVTIPADFSDSRPLRLVHLLSAAAQQALFPLTVITVGAGASITLIDEYISVEAAAAAAHLINGRIELVVGEGARVNYIRLQRWAPQAREFLLQRATLARQATLTASNITLGAALSKAHIVTKLVGEGSTANLSGFVFGHDHQHIDQHTLQDHQAPRTNSDLQYNAALQDESRMTYTGLIRIAKSAVQTNAYQANHNLMLSKTARAETIPMLEILADDVQCKHGASIGPIDDEQAFYLMSRGIARDLAERLIVMGFIETVMQKLPFEPLRERLRQEIESGIHGE